MRKGDESERGWGWAHGDRSPEKLAVGVRVYSYNCYNWKLRAYQALSGNHPVVCKLEATPSLVGVGWKRAFMNPEGN